MLSRTVAGAAVTVALIVAGCGGSSNETASFDGKVQTICAAADRQLGALGTPPALSGKRRDEVLARLVAREIPIDKSEIRKLGSLNAPGAERAPYADAVAEARDDVGALAKIVAALRSGSAAKLDSITEQSGALSDIAVAAMKRLHLNSCARNL
jgi:hypothetical protein